jgi:RNA polymerase sigma-70 factor (ECF subfamily)
VTHGSGIRYPVTTGAGSGIPLMMRNRSRWSDSQLLAGIAACDERAFSVFYRRHLATIVGWCVTRTRNPDLAADLTAEVFAAVLVSASRYQATSDTAVGWLIGIARNVLGHSLRSGQVDARARARLGAGALVVEDHDIELVLELAASTDGAAGQLLAELPADEQAAVRARVIEERGYAEIATELGCSEMVVRKRVSRGLSRLRAELATR